jgi:para-nitrobenzyl esterase
MNRSAIAILFALSLWLPQLPAQSAGPTERTSPVSIESGQISGVFVDKEIACYRGVPYAAPPVGNLRWRPPQSHPPWDGVRKCDTFGSAAVQFHGSEAGSEDCLFLNIWSKAEPNEKRPVMVWIHGGGWINGRSHSPIYDGLHFAERGVVFVSINYRLGALGFLAHPDLSAESARKVSGNYGLMDQMKALQWIQKNIAVFGGDPKNVTVFGQSAGATSIYALIASPLTAGLFQKAILQSTFLNGKGFRHLSKDTFAGPSAESVYAKRVADFLGNEQDPIATLRKMPAAEFATRLGIDWMVAIDGLVLPDFPHRIYAAGKQNSVSTIAGTNRDEGTTFVPGTALKSVDEFEGLIEEEFGDQSQLVLDLYGVDHVRKIRKALIDKATHGWFAQPTRDYVRSMAKQKNKAWLYQFVHKSLTRPYMGASHGSEAPFVFNNVDQSKFVGDNAAVSRAMIDYWVQFAESGDPNKEGLVEWPPFTEAGDQHLVIGREIKAESGLHKDASDVYDKVFSANRGDD